MSQQHETNMDLEILARDLEDRAPWWRNRGQHDLAGMLEEVARFARDQVGVRVSVYEKHYSVMEAGSNDPDDTPQLTEAQLYGFACVVCGARGGGMVPVALGQRGQLFAHPECADERPEIIEAHTAVG